MNVQMILAGALFCLVARVTGNPSQDAPTSKPAPAAQGSLTGCLDEQFGEYVLLDGQMVKITGLRSAGSEKDVFAKFLGHRVQVRGAKSAGSKAIFTVTGIENIADNCAPAK